MFRSFKQKSLVGIITLVIVLSLSSLAQAQGGTAELGVFEPQQVAPGATIQVPISVRNVQELYALDITMQFDPKLVQVEDADPSTTGIQVSLGEFLDPGLMLFNVADNEKGTFHFAMSQYNPSVGKSGEGIVLVINFKGVVAGESPLVFTSVQLSTREGIEIASSAVDSKLTVAAGAPTQAATIPVVVSTALIDINKITPVPTPTETPLPTATALATQPAEPVVQATPGSEGGQEPGYFLVENWWIVLILLVIVIAVGVYFFVLKKK